MWKACKRAIQNWLPLWAFLAVWQWKVHLVKAVTQAITFKRFPSHTPKLQLFAASESSEFVPCLFWWQLPWCWILFLPLLPGKLEISLYWFPYFSVNTVSLCIVGYIQRYCNNKIQSLKHSDTPCNNTIVSLGHQDAPCIWEKNNFARWFRVSTEYKIQWTILVGISIHTQSLPYLKSC